MEYLRYFWCCCSKIKKSKKGYFQSINLQEDIEYILKNFRVINYEVEQTINNIKNTIINSGVINEREIMLSPVHKSDNWKNIESVDGVLDGVYIVVAHVTKTKICKTRYLVYIQDNYIELVERKEINKLIEEKNIII